MKKEKMQQVAYMAMAISLMSFFSAAAGVFNENIYNEVYLSGTITKRLVVGSVAQDCITLPLSVILLILAIRILKAPSENLIIALMGMAGYFFYGYGLYVIQGQYTSLYMIYMIIFALSIYTLIFGLTGFNHKWYGEKCFPKGFRTSVAAFILLILIVLGPLWVFLMLSDIATRFPGETYGVYILDLCIVFPALAVSMARFYKNSAYGTLLAGVGLVKALTVCGSVAFAEWYVAYANFRAFDGFMFGVFSFLTLASLLLLVKYFFYIGKNEYKTESLI